MKRIAMLIFTISSLILAACNAPLSSTSPESAPSSESQPAADSSAPQSPALVQVNTTLTYPIVDTNQTTCYDNTTATACSELSVGASCSFTAPNGTVTGTCGTPPNSSQLVCMPAGERP